MAQNLQGADHKVLMSLLRGFTDEKGNYFTAPDQYSVKNTQDLWHNAGKLANDTADDMDKALKDLLQDGHGWSGKAADKFKAKVELVAWYARKLAHMCDGSSAGWEDPPKPAQDDDKDSSDPFPTDDTTGSGNEKSYAEQFDELHTTLSNALDTENVDKQLPMPPWWENGSQFWVKWYWSWGTHYEVRNDGKGKRTGVLKGGMGEDDFVGDLNKWGIPHHTTHDGMAGGQTIDDPYDNTEKVLFNYKINEPEEKTCQGTAKDIADKYSDIGGKFPPTPKAPQIQGKGGDPTGGGGSPGAGGGGMPPGGGGGGPMPKPPPTETPKPPPVHTPPEPPTNHPTPPDPPQNPGPVPPHDPTDPRGPGDPRTPGPPHQGPPGTFPSPPDRDHDGVPDDKDRWPDDPTRGGLPGGGSGGGGNIDTGTHTARTSGMPGGGIGGGPGSIGGGHGIGGGAGGIGGGAGGIGGGPGGGPGGGVGADGTIGGGAGAGGAGSGQAGARGGMMGGMMGGAHGGGGGEQGGEQERNTWLDEDEDVWGADDDAPPPVLGGGL